MSSSLNDGARLPAGALARLVDIDDGGFTEVEATIEGELASLILHRDGASVRAWFNVCPHAGRRLDWSPGRFLKSREGLLVCAVHGASFETHQGVCVAGPCRGDRLRAVPVVVHDGTVIVQDPDVPPTGTSG